MQKITRDDLMSLEDYSEKRNTMRSEVMAHKTPRRIALGANANLYFEDRLTMQYQIQEMLRAEKIFDTAGIQEELDAYNPLIPDGSNWKATFMLEYTDEAQRKQALGQLIGVENAVWVRIGDHAKVTPICDEDLERDTAEKTSSVHFMRFELTAEMIADLKAGANLAMGIDHPHMTTEVDPMSDESTAALLKDLD